MDTEKAIKIKMERTQIYGKIQNKMIWPGTGR
jgi:hypothetical protein